MTDQNRDEERNKIEKRRERGSISTLESSDLVVVAERGAVLLRRSVLVTKPCGERIGGGGF